MRDVHDDKKMFLKILTWTIVRDLTIKYSLFEMTTTVLRNCGRVTPFAVESFYIIQESASFVLRRKTENTATNILLYRIDAYLYILQISGLVQIPPLRSAIFAILIDISDGF